MNELKEIADRLNGYSNEDCFEILEAKKTDNGNWALIVTRKTNGEAENESNE